MTKIKNIINIILITVVVAPMVILAYRFIPFRDLNGYSIMDEQSINQVPDTGALLEEKPLEFDFEMIIDRASLPGKSVAAAEPPSGQEAAAEEEQMVESRDRDPAEDIEDADYAEDAGGIDQETVSGGHLDKEESESTSAKEEKILDDIDYDDSSHFRIEVDLSRQVLTVFYKSEILREMICSGGAPESPTPLGEYATSQKIEYDWVERFGVGAYYWIRFFEDYLIHSVPFDENGNMIIEEYEKLGNPASHGCIRLRLEEAKWLYETLPLGVKIVIY
jgi:lipoprotein-anchoring transpeptidase ErfK/SrfK